MNVTNDPQFIVNLLDPGLEHNCYFLVGDPCKGRVERIGVVAPMLMSHSMVLRHVLNVEGSELDRRSDIPLPDIEPHIFKNILRFTYGFSVIEELSLRDTIEILRIADKLTMLPLQQSATVHALNMLNPLTVYKALSHPYTLCNSELETTITKIVEDTGISLLNNVDIYVICPTGMKYLVQFDCLSDNYAEVFRTVIKWARFKALGVHYSESMGDHDVIRMIIPSREHYVDCCLTAINMVEQCLGGDTSRVSVLAKYHTFITFSLQSTFTCTCSDNKTSLTHKEMDVKIINDSHLWAIPLFTTSSELTINTLDTGIELFALVCSGIHQWEPDIPLDLFTNENVFGNISYRCDGSVTVLQVFDGCTSPIEIAHVAIAEQVAYKEQFQVPVHRSGPIKLQPSLNYQLKIEFSVPHPFWYSSEEPEHLEPPMLNFKLKSGLLSEKMPKHGSHIRYLLYRTFEGFEKGQ